jgi:hypothetical protein
MQSHAGILKRNALEQVWTQSKTDMAAWKQEAPTRKVRTARDVLEFCEETNSHLKTVYAFYSQNMFRRQRLSVYTKTRRMLECDNMKKATSLKENISGHHCHFHRLSHYYHMYTIPTSNSSYPEKEEMSLCPLADILVQLHLSNLTACKGAINATVSWTTTYCDPCGL